jgi:acyl transferase domain-containing protein
MNKRKLAVLFPGQGAYYKGILVASYPLYPQIAGVFAEIDEVSRQEFGQTLSDVLFCTPAQNSDDVLQSSPALLQLALYGVDVAIYKILESHCLQPDTFIGHSFGEIAALVCAGAFTVQEGAFIVAQRVKALQSVATGHGYMTALGTDVTHARKLLDLIGDQDTVVAAENHAGQTVISGTQETMNTIGAVCQLLKITFTKLNSPYPFHSPLLQPVVSDFAARIHHLQQRPLHTPVFSPIMQRYYSPDDKFTDCLAQQLVLPLNFAEAIQCLRTEGTQTFVECGALDTLAKLTKEILNVGTGLAPAQEDVDVLVSLDAKQDETNSLDSLLKELEQHGYITAKSMSQRLADIILPGVAQEDFSAFWMAMGKQVLVWIKQDYEIYMQNGVSLASAQKELVSTREEIPVQHTLVEAEHSIATLDHRPIQPETVAIVATKNRDQLFQEISTLYAELLDYSVEVFTDEVRLEAELGIDSIKQTELLTWVSEYYQLPPRSDSFRLSDYDTIGKVVDFVYSMLTQSEQMTPSSHRDPAYA